MESARINPKNPQGDYLLRPTCERVHNVIGCVVVIVVIVVIVARSNGKHVMRA